LFRRHFIHFFFHFFTDDSDEDPTFDPKAGEEDTEEDAEARQPSRKKVRREKEWNRVQRQMLRNRGKEYADRKGKVHREKKVQLYNHNCRFKCNNNLSEQKRQEIFDDYWGLGDYSLQTSFLNASLTLNDPIRNKLSSRRGGGQTCLVSA
jgi:hypothetical protein